MSTMTKMIKALEKTISHSPKEYARGRENQPALAPYATAALVLEALGKRSPLTPNARGELIGALVAEERRAAHPLWQGMLYAAFAPLLLRLRARAGKKRDDDADQKVLVAFLEAVRGVRLDGEMRFAPLSIRCAMFETIFSGLAADRDAPRPEEFDEEQHGFEVFATEKPAARAEDALRVVESAERGHAIAELLVVTHAQGLSLKELVEQRYASLDEAERAAIYQRLRNARRQAVLRMRARYPAVA